MIVQTLQLSRRARVGSELTPAASGKARSILSLAESYRKSGNREKAREKCQGVIDGLLGTIEAENARRHLAATEKR